MTEEKIGGRALKRQVLDLLMSKDLDHAVAELCALPGRRVVNPLVALFCHPDEKVRWRAITALGAVVDQMAQSHMEDARVIMRRLMWMLNDESGGIGWGAPEAMGEIMARNRPLAEEYSSVLVSYCDEEGNFLELEALQRGLLWGIGRLGQASPDLVRHAAGRLCKYLRSKDSSVRATAAWATGIVGASECVSDLRVLTREDSRIRMFDGLKWVQTEVGRLARDSLERIDTTR